MSANRYCGLCACGERGWAVLVTFVEPQDAPLLQARKWHAGPRGRVVYAEAGGRQTRGFAGYRGVYLEKKTGRWCANIARLKLGTFATLEEAGRAYDAAAIERFGEFATLNFAIPANRSPGAA
jgi:hypothetical protein